jgi:type II secretory ATPase GspE/PulE/Tfp pilus assembly ATPase PilB-like protein
MSEDNTVQPTTNTDPVEESKAVNEVPKEESKPVNEDPKPENASEKDENNNEGISEVNDTVLASILTDSKFISSADLTIAQNYVTSHHTNLIDYFLNQNVNSFGFLGQALAKYFDVEYADLDTYQPSREHISMIPPDIGQEYRLVVYKVKDDMIAVATDNPKRPGLPEELVKIFGADKKFQICYSLPDELNEILIHYRKPLVTRFNQIIQQQTHIAPEIIDEIIKDATAYKVSDIHFEPQETIVLIRFRIDGILHEAGQLPKRYYENILNRLKVQSHMRIDEHNVSQDGAIRYDVDGKPVNVRISVIPTLDGEKVALRLLAEYSQGLNIKSLGLSTSDKRSFDFQIHRPYGMIMTTGPTGSGKTTTLYSMVKIINSPEINITTIEDPVEYKIIGVNQIQVNILTKLTFSEGLRSVVRQDPDVIMVGEIRDDETAKLAVNAALTGHLLFSTFHANDASSAILRLLDMGVEPFLLSSTLNLVIAQRLVRMIHPSCRSSYTVKMEELKKTFPQAEQFYRGKEVTLFAGQGCEACNFTGYRGRTAIFELINVTPAMKDVIFKNPTASQITEQARKQGDRTLFEDGIDKVQRGVTTITELQRVAEAKQ